MSTAISNMISGRLVSEGGVFDLNLGFLPSRFELMNYTQMNSIANPAVVKKAVWFDGMDSGEAMVVKNTAGAATDESSLLSSGGIYLFDSTVLGVESAKAITSITQASPAVVTAASHGYAVGDIVRLYGTTGMKQVAGMDFEVTAVPTANTFEINLDASAFAAPATAGFARRLKARNYFQPERLFITKITQAGEAVVQCSVPHGIQDGQFVRVNVPQKFGMIEMNGLLGKAKRLSALSFSLDIDSSGFSAFAFPASADVPFTFAEAIPVGSFALGALPDANGVLYVPGSVRNVGFKGIRLGLSVVGAASDVLYFNAWKSDLHLNL